MSFSANCAFSLLPSLRESSAFCANGKSFLYRSFSDSTVGEHGNAGCEGLARSRTVRTKISDRTVATPIFFSSNESISATTTRMDFKSLLVFTLATIVNQFRKRSLPTLESPICRGLATSARQGRDAFLTVLSNPGRKRGSVALRNRGQKRSVARPRFSKNRTKSYGFNQFQCWVLTPCMNSFPKCNRAPKGASER